ncbi:amidohydrolase family protein [Nocardia terpenica]|uniref:Amidohydrolase n=1 Tax=Nocardia terpenica TaxID=455432 RepID=A0A0U1YZB3_9NOCA|nr:amidohydrolase family protein [Nocardia terpenica]AJO72758.1 amidohydrolase [Nocardia terpenica]KZM75379.1 amidohydrolase [Nocardia terpenica]NQE85841.1 amidohydrolase family protein [Nocardia terpenica]BBE00857.1 putative amidohydrolase [Nocardia terpenica]
MGTLVLTGAATVFSGDLAEPLLPGVDTVVCRDGVIAAVDDADRLAADLEAADQVIDLRGGTLAPGLIDSHGHVTFGDYSPRQRAVDYLAGYVHGGITTTVSAGEVHVPGRPRSAAGVKALAVAAHSCFAEYRPGGMRVHAGAVLIEPTLTEADFAELAGCGVRLAKFGFGAFAHPLDGRDQVRWAQAHGMTVMCHAGGASAAGGAAHNGEVVLALRPNVCGHANGGPTALSPAEAELLLTESDMALQVVQAGNLRAALHLVRRAAECEQLHRIVVGSDTPSGFGVMPLAVLKTVLELTALGGLEPAVAWSLATGNNADTWGLSAGRLAPGAPADVLALAAPAGSQADTAADALRVGDIPAITAVVTAGELRALPSRNTPRPAVPVVPSAPVAI